MVSNSKTEVCARGFATTTRRGVPLAPKPDVYADVKAATQKAKSLGATVLKDVAEIVGKSSMDYVLYEGRAEVVFHHRDE